MTWLITGASRGLGRHLALQLAQRGHRVLACARDADRLQTLAAESGGAVVPVVIDLADATQIGPRLGEALAREAHISGVVNNAGFGAYKPFLEHSEAESIQLVQVNLTAAIQVCHAVLPRLLAQRSGHIVNVGSDLARRPLANMAVYAAAKHGLAGFSHSLLREVKQAGVKVSLVNSGIVDTDFGGAAEGSRDAHWSLRPAQLAQLIIQLIEQPGNVVVDELSVHPLGQDF
ncbi:SDR family NAD(P)-dependent oxidoreductase [Piscinibacterium candidicorallinum]|uniref:SDR family NAD(P)-dependent oxidoreductase n=1 Tax=Piscinibacterium candidicorallinum TaxID=1793872 RepID=A0ABV7H6B2_9BURK